MSNAAIASSPRSVSVTLIVLEATAPDPAPRVLAWLAAMHGCPAVLRRVESRPAAATPSFRIEIEAAGLDAEQAMGLTRDLRGIDGVTEIRVRWRRHADNGPRA